MFDGVVNKYVGVEVEHSYVNHTPHVHSSNCVVRFPSGCRTSNANHDPPSLYTGGENSVNVDKNMYDTKRQSIFNKQQFYSDQLSRYLNEKYNLFPELGENTELYQFIPDYGSQYRSPIVMQRNTRAVYLNLAQRAGLPIVNSAYPSFPPPGPNKNQI